MTSMETTLFPVEKWKEKTFEFSRQPSSDTLAPVFLKAFELMSFITKDSELRHIQRAGESLRLNLDSALSNFLEEIREDDSSIDYLLYGLLEFINVTLIHLTDNRIDIDDAVFTIETWERKAFDFANQCDYRIPVISRAFNLMSMILKNSEYEVIVKALELLDKERLNCISFEDTQEFSMRTMTYGLIESLHLTIRHIIEQRNENENTTTYEGQGMEVTAAAEAASVVAPTVSPSRSKEKEECRAVERFVNMGGVRENSGGQIEKMKRWRIMERKSGTISVHPSSIPPPFPVMVMPLRYIEWSAKRATAIFNSTRRNQIGGGDVSGGTKRDEGERSKKRPTTHSGYGMFPAPTTLPVLNWMARREDVVVSPPPSGVELAPTNGRIRKRRFSNVHAMNMERPATTVRTEEVKTAEAENEMSLMDGLDDSQGSIDLELTDSYYEETTMESADTHQDYSEDVEYKRRRSRSARKPINYAESTASNDKEFKRALKKPISDSEDEMDKSSAKKRRKSSNGGRPLKHKNDKELECHKCEFRSQSITSWYKHLLNIHSTSPLQEGLIIRCDCGHKSRSHNHAYDKQCKIKNFTVYREEDESTDPNVGLNREDSMEDSSIDRAGNEEETAAKFKSAFKVSDGDEEEEPSMIESKSEDVDKIRDGLPVTPKCILCKKFPFTANGYAIHLKAHHKTTLIKSGYYLLCKCGVKVTSEHRNPCHTRKGNCLGRQFTLHRLAEN